MKTFLPPMGILNLPEEIDQMMRQLHEQLPAMRPIRVQLTESVTSKTAGFYIVITDENQQQLAAGGDGSLAQPVATKIAELLKPLLDPRPRGRPRVRKNCSRMLNARPIRVSVEDPVTDTRAEFLIQITHRNRRHLTAGSNGPLVQRVAMRIAALLNPKGRGRPQQNRERDLRLWYLRQAKGMTYLDALDALAEALKAGIAVLDQKLKTANGSLAKELEEDKNRLIEELQQIQDTGAWADRSDAADLTKKAIKGVDDWIQEAEEKLSQRRRVQ